MSYDSGKLQSLKRSLRCVVPGQASQAPAQIELCSFPEDLEHLRSRLHLVRLRGFISCETQCLRHAKAMSVTSTPFETSKELLFFTSAIALYASISSSAHESFLNTSPDILLQMCRILESFLSKSRTSACSASWSMALAAPLHRKIPLMNSSSVTQPSPSSSSRKRASLSSARI